MPPEVVDTEALKKAIKGVNPMKNLGLEDEEGNEYQPPIEEKKDEQKLEEKKAEEERKKAEEDKKKGKGDQIKDLVAQKDKLSQEIESLKKKLEELEPIKPLRKVADHLKAKTKKDALGEEDVDEFLKTTEEKEKTIKELEDKYKEKDMLVRDYEITASDEWQQNYAANIIKSKDLLQTTVVNFDEAGKPRAPAATQKFLNIITSRKKDGKPLTPQEIKQEFSKFKKEFEDEAGVDYESPGISELVKSAESFHGSVDNALKAKANWTQESEKKKKERLFAQAKQQEEEAKKELEGRNYIIRKLKGSEQVKQVAEVLDTDEVKFESFINAEHEFMNKALAGDPEHKPRGYDDFIIISAKGKAFDPLLKKYQEIQQERDELLKQLESGLPIGGRKTSDEKKKDGEQIKFNKDESPMSRMGLDE